VEAIAVAEVAAETATAVVEAVLLMKSLEISVERHIGRQVAEAITFPQIVDRFRGHAT